MDTAINDEKGIIRRNLDLLAKKAAEAYEGQICEISALAARYAKEAQELIGEGAEIMDCIILLSEELRFEPGEAPSGVLPENEVRVDNIMSTLTEYEKINFTELYTEALSKLGITLTEDILLGASPIDATVTYVKNLLSDEAYDVFSESLDDPRVAYAKDFKEAAGAVRDGVVGYAVLPLEEGGDYRIPMVNALIYANDLKILSVTPVFGFDGNADLKCALVASGFTPIPYSSEDDRYLELLIPKSDGSEISAVLMAASSFGAEAYRINSVNFDGDSGNESYYSVILKRQGENFVDVLTYLSVFVSGYLPVGIYKNLE